MRIISKSKVEDCFDGSSVYRYWFAERWTRASIQELRALGELEYFADFPKPFFRVCSKNGMQFKGVEGESSCQVVYPRQDKEAICRGFEDHFESEDVSTTAQVDERSSA